MRALESGVTLSQRERLFHGKKFGDSENIAVTRRLAFLMCVLGVRARTAVAAYVAAFKDVSEKVLRQLIVNLNSHADKRRFLREHKRVDIRRVGRGETGVAVKRANIKQRIKVAVTAVICICNRQQLL